LKQQNSPEGESWASPVFKPNETEDL
jgi:hypothetical protein